jgi:intracellular sulfur oxidation DsrE/DsrF family protein
MVAGVARLIWFGLKQGIYHVKCLAVPLSVNIDIKDGGVQMKRKNLVKAMLLTSIVLGSAAAYADGTVDTGIVSPCSYPPIVGDPNNSDICVDVPVNLKKDFVVFNNNENAISSFQGGPAPLSMKHMIMLGGAMLNRINNGLMQAHDVSIIGVFHGNDALSWLLNDAWWQAHHGTDNPYKKFIEQMFAMKNNGLNIQLEACGVTMHGMGVTNSDLYTSGNGQIYVNQGAVGRLIDLEQNDYVYYQPGM